MYQRILVPLDGSETGQAGLLHAIALARTGPATLLLLHVLDGPVGVGVGLRSGAGRPADEESARRAHRDALEVLSRGRATVQEAGLHCETLLREFTGTGVADVIEQQALLHHCDLVVMGAHRRRGLDWLAWGSEAQQVARDTRVPLLLVPSG